jgi:hypothetical protein
MIALHRKSKDCTQTPFYQFRRTQHLRHQHYISNAFLTIRSQSPQQNSLYYITHQQSPASPLTATTERHDSDNKPESKEKSNIPTGSLSSSASLTNHSSNQSPLTCPLLGTSNKASFATDTSHRNPQTSFV